MRKTIVSRILGVGCRRFAVANWIFVLAFILHNSSFILASDPPSFADANSGAAGWSQYQCTADRKGYTPDSPAPPYKAAWSYRFVPERVHTVAQPVVCGGRVFMGTMNGNLYALDAINGELRWKAELGRDAGVMHAVGCGDGLVIVACMDGTVRALQTADGAPAWCFQSKPAKGFSTAPCLAQDSVFIGNRNGVFYALELKTGAKRWERDTGAPIFNTAAYNDGRVVFGNEDIRIFSLDAATGDIAWVSDSVTGPSLTDHCPVIHAGKVFIRPLSLRTPKFDVSQMNLRVPVDDNPWAYGPGIPWLHENLYGNYRAHVLYGWQQKSDDSKTAGDREVENLIDALLEGEMPDEILDAQEQYIRYLESHPRERQFFALDEKTGELQPPGIEFMCVSLSGGMSPPAVTADGMLVVQWKYPNACWALLDPETGRAVRILPAGWPTNPDETVFVSVGGRRVFAMHYCHAPEIGINAVFDFDLKRWVPPGIGGREAPVHGAPTELGVRAENCGSATHAAAISGNMFYHAMYDTLYAAEGKE